MVIAAVHTDAVRAASQFEACLAAVSADRRSRVRSLVHEDDRRRSLCAGLALKACLNTVGLCEAAEPIVRDEHGCPRLRLHPEWHFSLSHSGEWGVCALAESPVGIDVERQRAVQAERLAERYFSPQEATWLKTLTESERQQAFFRLWTAKESVLKAQGVGLSGGLSVPIGYGDTLLAPSPWQLREYSLPGYAVTVCGTEVFPQELLTFSSFDSALLR